MPEHFRINGPNYAEWSPRWVNHFDGPWTRLRAAAKAQNLSRQARHRLEWMIWYWTKADGNARATCRHFGISPKVFYFWKNRFSETALVTLEERSHRPHRLRESTLNGTEIERIVALRQRHLRYSKLKLAILYREQYGEPISSWKIQQVIQRHQLYPNPKAAENTAKKRRRAVKKKRITDLLAQKQTGFLFCLDTVFVRFAGKKRVILTAIDRHSRFAYARMYRNPSSAAAADFLRRLYRLMDGKLVHIQTDNGSEFMKYFEVAINDLKLTHWWSRAYTPKDNPICERFNRTIKEEFVGAGNGFWDCGTFNLKLVEWLVEYDCYRPHAALGYRRPIELTSIAPEALRGRLSAVMI